MNHSSMKKNIFMFLAFGCLFICTNNLTAGEIESNLKNVFVGTYLFTTQYDWNIQDGVSLEKSKPNILKVKQNGESELNLTLFSTEGKSSLPLIIQSESMATLPTHPYPTNDGNLLEALLLSDGKNMAFTLIGQDKIIKDPVFISESASGIDISPGTDWPTGSTTVIGADISSKKDMNLAFSTLSPKVNIIQIYLSSPIDVADRNQFTFQVWASDDKTDNYTQVLPSPMVTYNESITAGDDWFELQTDDITKQYIKVVVTDVPDPPLDPAITATGFKVYGTTSDISLNMANWRRMPNHATADFFVGIWNINYYSDPNLRNTLDGFSLGNGTITISKIDPDTIRVDGVDGIDNGLLLNIAKGRATLANAPVIGNSAIYHAFSIVVDNTGLSFYMAATELYDPRVVSVTVGLGIKH